ncbi:MAG: phage portal protein [Acidobacteria bacterium 13_1_20CM_3_53_8]|nr:MAG: phage portal protein [Acidobacteria bacterium 13_1_20CM_3_53_8]
MHFFKDLAPVKAVKSAYNKIPVGQYGRPQYPSVSVFNLNRFYKTNELAFSCIRAIAYAAMDPEPVVERKTANKWGTEEGHPLRSLLMWPNPSMSGAEFMQTILTSAQISGWFYAEIVRDGLGLPDQLWPLDPSKIFPVPGDDGQGGVISGYEFRDGTIKEFIPAKDMIAYRLPNPGSRFEALSPLMVALGTIDADVAMTDYIRAFFDGGGMPRGVVKVKRSLSDEQITSIQQRWLLRYGRRGKMKEAPAVLDNETDYTKIGASMDELENETIRGQHESRICGAFGVPPILVGAYVALVNVNQRASVRESQRDFWQNTMSPTFTQLRLFFTTRLLPEFEPVALIRGERVRCGWNMDHVAGMQEDTDAVHKRARDDFNGGGLSWNEFRAKIGESPDPDGNFFLLPTGFKPITPKIALAQATTLAATDTSTSADGGGDPGAGGGAGNSGDGNQGGKSTANPNRAPQVKSFEYEGLSLRREPTALEKKAGLPQIVAAMDEGEASLEKTLLRIREAMINTCVEDLQKLDPGDYHTLAITISGAQTKQVRSSLSNTFERGRESVTRELQTQAEGKAIILRLSSKAASPGAERLDELALSTLTKLANDVQARAVGRASELILLGLSPKDDAQAAKVKPASFWKQLETDLEEGSTQYAKRAASGATNAALNLGRTLEAEERADEIKEVVYSAVLDQNTCGPCEDADGETGATDDDVTSVPNPICEGGSQCRCLHIHVLA